MPLLSTTTVWSTFIHHIFASGTLKISSSKIYRKKRQNLETIGQQPAYNIVLIVLGCLENDSTSESEVRLLSYEAEGGLWASVLSDTHKVRHC